MFPYRCRSRGLVPSPSRWSIAVNLSRSRGICRITSQLRHGRRRATTFAIPARSHAQPHHQTPRWTASDSAGTGSRRFDGEAPCATMPCRMKGRRVCAPLDRCAQSACKGSSTPGYRPSSEALAPGTGPGGRFAPRSASPFRQFAKRSPSASASGRLAVTRRPPLTFAIGVRSPTIWPMCSKAAR
jgi:hypothetical protein